ncbi:MAG TPA: aromatic-ring-hydroxylating dioxygenase subunit beta [Pseudonocardia sp.]|nr:aromatic-ring-hydroxylating dioxygenase subunit beta [Pseudonocardia sp.]
MTATLPTSGTPSELDRMLLTWSVQEFYSTEATILDKRRLDEWLALWNPDRARYWAPVRRTREGHEDFTDPGELGLFEDDFMTLNLRVAAMKAPSAWAESPPSRTRRLITNVQAARAEDDTVAATSNFLVYRSRLESIEHLFVGRRTDVLEPSEHTVWRIRERTVLLDHSSFRTDNISVLF